MKLPRATMQKGFTLIEIIAVLLVVAIFGAMIFPYLGKTVMNSSEPIFWFQDSLDAREVMENVTAVYEASDKSFASLHSLLAQITFGNFDSAGFRVSARVLEELDSTNDHEPTLLQVTINNRATNQTLITLFTEVD